MQDKIQKDYKSKTLTFDVGAISVKGPYTTKLQNSYYADADTDADAGGNSSTLYHASN